MVVNFDNNMMKFKITVIFKNFVTKYSKSIKIDFDFLYRI